MTNRNKAANLYNLSFGKLGRSVVDAFCLPVSVYHVLRVLFVSSYFKMANVYTQAIITLVSNHESGRDLSVMMRPYSSVRLYVSILIPDRAISAVDYTGKIKALIFTWLSFMVNRAKRRTEFSSPVSFELYRAVMTYWHIEPSLDRRLR